MFVNPNGTLAQWRPSGYPACGRCRARLNPLDPPWQLRQTHCDLCGWRLEEPCPDCGAAYPRTPGYDALRHHRKACRNRGLAQTLRNLVRMYDNARAGRPCARYITDQEWAHLLRFLEAT